MFNFRTRRDKLEKARAPYLKMFSAGDLILFGKPFAFALYNEGRSKFCDHCFRKLESKLTCHNCRYVTYCSRSCQREGQAYHVHECPVLAERPMSTLTRLIARIIIKVEREPDAYDVIDGQKRSWADLMDHYENVIHDADAMLAFNRIYADIESLLEREIDIAWLISIYGKVLVNSFAVQDELMRPIGRAVYLGVSIFDHSCKPEASFTFIGTTIYIKAITDILHNSLRRIKICYLDELDTSEERIRQLSLHYYFNCSCERCTKKYWNRIEMIGDKCLRDICYAMEDMSMDSVSAYLSRQQLAKRGVISDNQEVLLNMFSDDYKRSDALHLMARMEANRKGFLTMKNVLSIRVADFVTSLEGHFELALKVIDAFRTYYGRNHPRLALKLYLTAISGLTNKNINYPVVQKLLLEAKTIAAIFVPNLAEQMKVEKELKNSNDDETFVEHVRGRQRGRTTFRPVESSSSFKKERPVTLLSLIEKELNSLQQEIQFKYRWRSQSTHRDFCRQRNSSSNRHLQPMRPF
ncbi:N-lysine methyltransferase SMYD2-A [Halotydeus destructor]|nr:N-lysine methyltransferase SMYD2-A [Halotydeus destructor]